MRKKKIIFVRKTTFVREGGRHLRYAVFSAISNGKNKIGIGCAKSKDFSNAILKSFKIAKDKYFKFKLKYLLKKENQTFKVGKTFLKFFRITKNCGLIAGGNVRKIFLLTGIKNIICKIFGSKNKVNVIKATENFFYYLKK